MVEVCSDDHQPCASASRTYSRDDAPLKSLLWRHRLPTLLVGESGGKRDRSRPLQDAAYTCAPPHLLGFAAVSLL
jgi:hypothetical protein